MSDNSFRVWCKDRNEWEKHLITLDTHGTLWHAPVQIRPEQHVIQFYTGILDKNANKIFEGDKLRFSHWIIEVERYLGAFGYWVDKDKEWKMFIPFSGHNQIEYFGNQTNDLEVVGHIYAN